MKKKSLNGHAGARAIVLVLHRSKAYDRHPSCRDTIQQKYVEWKAKTVSTMRASVIHQILQTLTIVVVSITFWGKKNLANDQAGTRAIVSVKAYVRYPYCRRIFHSSDEMIRRKKYDMEVIQQNLTRVTRVAVSITFWLFLLLKSPPSVTPLKVSLMTAKLNIT